MTQEKVTERRSESTDGCTKPVTLTPECRSSVSASDLSCIGCLPLQQPLEASGTQFPKASV